MKKCECGNMLSDNTTVCSNCGLVIQEEIVNLPERITDKDLFLEKSQSSPTLPDLEFLTFNKRNTRNKELQRVFTRLEYYTDNSRDFFRLSGDICRIGSQLRLPNHIIKDAKIFCLYLWKNNYFKEKHVKKTTPEACIVLAAKLWAYPLTIPEVAEFSNFPKKEIRRSYFLIRRVINITPKKMTIFKIIQKRSNRLNFSKRERKEAILLSQKIDEKATKSGKSLNGYAAAVVYLVKRGKMTRDEVSELFGITPNLITRRKREVKKL